MVYSNDLSLLGEYTVTLRSEITVPDDYSLATSTLLFVEEVITVYVEPCMVSSYIDTTAVTSITYNIGALDLTDGLYVFDEDPVCGYPETVTVTNLPAWATHNEASADFTIPSNSDLSLIGAYTVTLRSEICTPDDYTGATCSVLFVEYDFTIFIEPCIITSYVDSLNPGVIEYFIGEPALTAGGYGFTQD